MKVNYEEITAILNNEKLSNDERKQIIDFIDSKMNEIKRIAGESAERKEKLKSIHTEKRSSDENELNEKLKTLETKIETLFEKIQPVKQEISADLESALKSIPDNYKRFIPELAPQDKLAWIENAMTGGLFNIQGTEEIGSEITVTENAASSVPVRAMSEKDLLALNEKEYNELKKSGKLDYLIRNNLITE